MRILLALLVSLFYSVYAEADVLVLEIGSSKNIASPTSGAVRIKNGKFVSVSDLGSSLRVTGRKVGSSTITTNAATTDVHVLSADDFAFYQEAKDEIVSMRGLELTVDENGIAVRGRLLRLSDWESIASLSGSAKYNFAAEIDLSIKESVRELIERRLKSSSLNLPVIKYEPTLSVLVAKEQSKQRELYARSLQPYGVNVESTDSVVELQPLVRVRIAVTEIRKGFLQKFGVSWPTSAKAQLLPTFVAPGAAEGISVQLDALEENGFGKILASPNILCRSGKTAEFFAGGEFPIKMIGHKKQEVTWRKHGIILKVAPVADPSGRMSIALTTEVSTIDQSQTVDGVPGILINRIESHFDLSQSRTIALSGLLREESGTSRQGLPGLSSIPILGLLFSSQDYRNQKTELIVFVTPEVVKEDDKSL